jgi:hypothetical protein
VRWMPPLLCFNLRVQLNEIGPRTTSLTKPAPALFPRPVRFQDNALSNPGTHGILCRLPSAPACSQLLPLSPGNSAADASRAVKYHGCFPTPCHIVPDGRVGSDGTDYNFRLVQTSYQGSCTLSTIITDYNVQLR